jgi:hypothetical protein
MLLHERETAINLRAPRGMTQMAPDGPRVGQSTVAPDGGTPMLYTQSAPTGLMTPRGTRVMGSTRTLQGALAQTITGSETPSGMPLSPRAATVADYHENMKNDAKTYGTAHADAATYEGMYMRCIGERGAAESEGYRKQMLAAGRGDEIEGVVVAPAWTWPAGGSLVVAVAVCGLASGVVGPGRMLGPLLPAWHAWAGGRFFEEMEARVQRWGEEHSVGWPAVNDNNDPFDDLFEAQPAAHRWRQQFLLLNQELCAKADVTLARSVGDLGTPRFLGPVPALLLCLVPLLFAQLAISRMLLSKRHRVGGAGGVQSGDGGRAAGWLYKLLKLAVASVCVATVVHCILAFQFLRRATTVCHGLRGLHNAHYQGMALWALDHYLMPSALLERPNYHCALPVPELSGLVEGGLVVFTLNMLWFAWIQGRHYISWILKASSFWTAKRDERTEQHKWEKRTFEELVNFSVNILDIDGYFFFRTLFEMKLEDLIYSNKHMLRVLQEATRLTVEGYPFLYCLRRDHLPQINNAILNRVSERFSAAFILQEAGLPTVTRTYHFALTCERSSWVGQSKLRVMIASSELLKGLTGSLRAMKRADISPRWRPGSENSDRWATILEMARLMDEGSPLVGKLDLAIPAPGGAAPAGVTADLCVDLLREYSRQRNIAAGATEGRASGAAEGGAYGASGTLQRQTTSVGGGANVPANSKMNAWLKEATVVPQPALATTAAADVRTSSFVGRSVAVSRRTAPEFEHVD